MAEKESNAPEISVTELSSALKRTIEDRFGFVRVRGEVSGWRGPHSSGHVYFCLKDQGAKIDAVIWKGAYQRLRVKPEEGMEVIATGKVTTYPGKSTYQIVVETIEPAGVGALLAQLEERRRRLAAEGLFDDARKQLLPFLPSVVGVVTSPTGAVIRDILHRVADRFPLRVIVWPVRVQGDTSAAEVARAIEGFNTLPEGGKIPRPDVIIVARGGGSLEDLWGFNEEIVVRAAASSMIPLVSAVGHETDWTLIDHAADRRAPTPTAAAEMTVPVRSEMAAQADALARRLLAVTLRLSERRRADVRALVRALPSPEDVLAMPRQRLDRAGENLPQRVAAALNDRHLKLNRLGALVARHSPRAELARRTERVAGLGERLRRAMITRREAERVAGQRRRERLQAAHERMRNALRACSERRRRDLESVLKLIDSMSHRSVLARGFALVRDGGPDGAPVRSAASVTPGQALTLQFADGSVAATANGGGAPPGASDPPVRQKAARPGRAPAGPVANQGSLF
ncbi:MAG: exodeoxyribonuclease VII large subunit [Beijerinckiaceae bacterium]